MKSDDTMTVLSELLAGAVEERVAALVQGLKDELADIVREQVDQALTEHGVMEPLMSIKDVAKTLRVSPRTVEDLLIMNRVLNPIWVGGQRRFFPDDVRAYLHSQRRYTSIGKPREGKT